MGKSTPLSGDRKLTADCNREKLKFNLSTLTSPVSLLLPFFMLSVPGVNLSAEIYLLSIIMHYHFGETYHLAFFQTPFFSLQSYTNLQST